MSTLSPSLSEPQEGLPGRAAGTLADEVAALAGALMNPGRLIDEVTRMHALQVEAARIEASDPELAACLRQRAARIGMR